MKKITLATILITINYFLCFGQIENCLDFNGVNSYVSIGNAIDLDTSNFTIEAWIYVESISTSNKIVNKGGTMSGTPSNSGYFLRTNAPWVGENSVEFTIGGISNGASVVSDSLKLNEWMHIAGVRKEKKMYLYINGEMTDSTVTNTILNVNTNIPLAIGALQKPNGVQEFMDGKIDEVRIWNIARTQEDIFIDKDCAIKEPIEGLLAVYNFDSENGDVAIDGSGNGLNGTLVDSSSWVASEVAKSCMTSNNNFNLDKLSLYPNPFNNTLNVQGLSGNIKIAVFDSNGTLMVNDKLSNNRINLQGLNSGIYTILVKKENESYLKKIIKYK